MQTNNAIMKDGFRSFPSGHSASMSINVPHNFTKETDFGLEASFAGLFYLSLYLAGKLHILDSRGEVWKMFVCLVPTLGAALVAGSRIMDARHHPFDVIFGSLLGIAIAWICYRQYFPSPSDVLAKGRAYPMRTWGKDIATRQAELQNSRQDALDRLPRTSVID
jgi:diacylglycerol diphosphate phosphatase / phosphatidate phosphatase